MPTTSKHRAHRTADTVLVVSIGTLLIVIAVDMSLRG